MLCPSPAILENRVLASSGSPWLRQITIGVWVLAAAMGLAFFLLPRPVGPRFKARERFESQLLNVPVMKGFYPLRENQNAFRRMFSATPDELRSFDLLLSSGAPDADEELYLSNGARQMVKYSVRRIKVSCTDAYSAIEKSVEVNRRSHPEASGERVDLGEAEWLMAWDGARTMDYWHCRDEWMWHLTYVDLSAVSKSDLIRFSRNNVEKAHLVSP